MKQEEVLAKIQKIAKSGTIGREEQLAAAADLIARFLQASLLEDESRGLVTLLLLRDGGKQFAFAHPSELREGNYFPVNDKSMAGRALASGCGVLSNNLPGELHFRFYERVPSREGAVRTIQKMIACPLFVTRNKVAGVVEVSRTGMNLDDAGPDFTQEDLAQLEHSGRLFGPCLHQLDPGRKSLVMVRESRPDKP